MATRRKTPGWCYRESGPELRASGRSRGTARARARGPPGPARGAGRRWRRGCFRRRSGPVSSRRPSGTIATPAAADRSGRAARPGRGRSAGPSPPAARRTPPTASTRLDLPAPFGPSRAVTSPAGMSIVTSLTTARRPRWTVMPRSASVSASRSRGDGTSRSGPRGVSLMVPPMVVSQDLRRTEIGAASPARRAAPPRSGRPISLPKSSTAVVSQHADTRLMSWSTRIISAPACSGIRRITSPRCSVSASGRPAAGSSSSTSRGLPTTALATSTRRRCPAPSVATLADGSGPSPTNSMAPSTSGRRPAPQPECSWIIATFSKIESSSIACSVWKVRRTPQRARRKCDHREQVLAEGADRPRAGRTNPLSTLKNVVFPAPLGPISPQVPLTRMSRSAVQRDHPAEVDGEAVNLDHRRTPAAAGARLRARPQQQPSEPGHVRGNWSAMPAGAVVSTCSTPTPNRIVRICESSPRS